MPMRRAKAWRLPTLYHLQVVRTSAPLVIGGSLTTTARATIDTRWKELATSIMPPVHRSDKKHPRDTTIEPSAAKRILVDLEANVVEAIHKGKYPVTEWLYKVVFPKDFDSIEGLDADDLLQGSESPSVSTRYSFIFRTDHLQLHT